MSKISNNPLLKGVSGMLGKTIVFREVRGKVVMSNWPKKAARPTPHQIIMSKRFTDAIKYAKVAMQSTSLKEAYAAAITPNKFTAFHVAQTDAMTAPVVHSINTEFYNGTPGDELTIHATDDFRVDTVCIKIQDPYGMLIEEGIARRRSIREDEWEYTVSQVNEKVIGSKIIVSVRDLPGNVATLESVL